MPQISNNKQAWRYFFFIVKAFPLPIAIMFWTAIFWAFELSLHPYILKIILNRLENCNHTEVFTQLAMPIGWYLGIHCIMSTSFRLYNYFVEIKMIPQMRAHIANHGVGSLVEQSHNYYQNNFAGSLTNKINDLINSIPDLLQILIDRFLSTILAIVIAAITLWQVNKYLALVMLIWICVFTIGSWCFSKRLTQMADVWSEQGTIITGKIVDVLANILAVRLFSAKKLELANLNYAFNKAVIAEQKLQWGYLWMWLVYGYSFVALQCLNFYLLCKGRYEGWITIGDFALVLVINIAIADFLWQLTKDFSQFSKLFGKITQALRTIMVAPEIQDPPNALALATCGGHIEFDQVEFNYHGAKVLFKNKSVIITPGQKVGLVGYSGSGKSTFVNLILRLHEVSNGKILLDGHDIRSITQHSLRANIAMIPQDPALFHRSVLDNIRYSKPDATEAEVIAAAQKAHADEFIKTIPNGYHALVGERGIKLSGGQRQRIAIARAILKNSPILILDEATSQLDSVTESYIQQSLWELMANKTTIVIAHRLSTLLKMDRILVFDNGAIVEDGTHDSLLASGGLYKVLWDAQVGGWLPKNRD